MLDIQFAGTDLYHILNWFYIYSFIGWLWESIYVSIKERRLVNRGFVTGPLCTIYGCGALAIYIFLRPVSGNILLLYIGGFIVPTILEYITAVLMEHLFHTSWWDYSTKKFNFQGRICLSASLGWGFASVLFFYVLHPAVEKFVALYTVAVGKIMLSVVTVLFAFDFGLSYMNALQIGEKLKSLDELTEDLFDFVQSSKIYDSVEDLKEKLAYYRTSEYSDEVRRRLEARVDAVIAFTGGSKQVENAVERAGAAFEKAEDIRDRLDGRKEQLEKRMADFQKNYENIRRQGNFFTRRAMNAYPNMKSRAQALKERAARKKKNKREND